MAQNQTSSIHIDHEKIVKDVEDLYSTSKCYVNNGLLADENGNKELAVKHYLDALQCLEMVTAINLDGLEGNSLIAAKSKKEELLGILQHVRSRLYELESSAPPLTTASSPTNSMISININDSSPQLSLSEQFNESALEILHIPGGVQLFSVEEGLEVNAAPPSYPTSLSVYKFERVSLDLTRPPGFLQVGDWIYPLVPRQSPVLRCRNGAFVFPNPTTGSSNSNSRSIGLVISSVLDPCFEETFIEVLRNMANLQEQDHQPSSEPSIDLRNTIPYQPTVEEEEKDKARPSSSTSHKIASGIETGADWLSWGLSKSAEFTTKLISQGADLIQRNITPNEKPAQVHPTVEKGLYYTHRASEATVLVSGALVKGLCAVTGEIANGIKPHLQSLLPASEPGKEQGSSTGKGALHIASAGLQGFSTVWKSLEDSGVAIAKSASKATVDTMQHKYGQEVGKSTGHAMGAAVNCARTAFHVDNLGIKAIVKRTAKDTGKTVLKDYGSGSSSPGSSRSVSSKLSKK